MKNSLMVFASSIGAGVLPSLTGCAFVEMSGTMTRATGEIMSEYSKQNEGIIGSMVGVGGRINTAVGASVEKVAKKGRSGDLGKTKKEQFISANREVMSSAHDAAFSYTATEGTVAPKEN